MCSDLWDFALPVLCWEGAVRLYWAATSPVRDRVGRVGAAAPEAIAPEGVLGPMQSLPFRQAQARQTKTSPVTGPSMLRCLLHDEMSPAYAELRVPASYSRTLSEGWAVLPANKSMTWAIKCSIAPSENIAPLGAPGRFTINVRPRDPAMPRDSTENFVCSRPFARISSAMPGISRSRTACVASGVTSRGEIPVPPVVRMSDAPNSSAQ